jgi:hypothetical protein
MQLRGNSVGRRTHVCPVPRRAMNLWAMQVIHSEAGQLLGWNEGLDLGSSKGTRAGETTLHSR